MLYIIATPIGNLEDFTDRAKRVLEDVDLVLAEDTRVSRKILEHFNISKKEMLSFNEYADENKINKIVEMAEEKNIAFLCDAGTPNISDPGFKLIQALKDKVEIIPIPGASALITLISVADVPMDKFLFLGFPPAKKKRNKFFELIKESVFPVVIYESPHRIKKTLKDLEDSDCIIGRELTKKFETIYYGKANELIDSIKEKGEFVIIIKKCL